MATFILFVLVALIFVTLVVRCHQTEKKDMEKMAAQNRRRQQEINASELRGEERWHLQRRSELARPSLEAETGVREEIARRQQHLVPAAQRVLAQLGFSVQTNIFSRTVFTVWGVEDEADEAVVFDRLAEEADLTATIRMVASEMGGWKLEIEDLRSC